MLIEVLQDLDIAIFAERLRKTRLARDMTQGAVAQAAGLNKTHYNELERGKTPGLRVETLYKLCQVLHVSTDYLLGLTDLRLAAWDGFIEPESALGRRRRET